MGEQRLQPGQLIPSSCILHNNLFVRSQRSGHTPEQRQVKHKNSQNGYVKTEQGLHADPFEPLNLILSIQIKIT